uniref:Uncharacterized protein n=1 Tax=Candidatus Methanogaster sp. ANME-2c ERB4 TaxID=2759911 RepID=A0A7G9Y899_9EURY|nr:hypothetical protein JAFNDAPN_00016 [Methanosarcinales archaeon ANME-2c ERB4]QNO46525.1 hypothetical protein HKKCGBCL_00001 [Methanosarcinales archaeon ANME-2c ERB4]
MTIKDSEDSEMLVREVHAIMKKYDVPFSAPAIRKLINNAAGDRKTTDGEVTYALENVLVPSKIADKMMRSFQFQYYLIKRKGNVNDAIKKEIEKGNKKSDSKEFSPIQEAMMKMKEGEPNTVVPIGNGVEIYIKPTMGQLVVRRVKNRKRKNP